LASKTNQSDLSWWEAWITVALRNTLEFLSKIWCSEIEYLLPP